MITSTSPPTASTIPGSSRIGAGVESGLLPPWVEAWIAVAPAAPARLAASRRAGGERLAVTHPVHLEERLVVGRADVLERAAGERRQAQRGAARGRGPGDGHLALGVDRLHARRRDDDGHGDLLAHDRRRQG